MSATETDSDKVVLKRSGDLTIKEEGQDVVIAHYDKNKGHLEFVSKEANAKYYNQVTARIGTVSNGTQPSNMVIRSIAVKGEQAADLKNAPKRPKLGPLGDAAEDVVQWYLSYDMPQAIVRYGLFCDENGKPIRKAVKRVLENTVDQRDLDDEDIEPTKDGRSSKVKAPVARQREVIEMKDAYIARRATALTFIPQEVVGGFVPDDDNYDTHTDTVEGDQ
jgi:hypothetical protein